MNETDLILEVVERGSLFSPFSARECTQSLTPIPQDSLRRTINGVLVCVGNKGHHKFQSTISCKDKAPPAFENLWVGTHLKVGCLQSLTQTIPAGASRIFLEREPLRCYAYDPLEKMWPIEKVEGNSVFLSPGCPGGFITYRPWLRMVVKHYHLETDEWEASVGWRLELEEE